MGEVLGSGGGARTEGLVEGSGLGVGGRPHQAAPRPGGPTHPVCPHWPRVQAQVHMLQPRGSQGPRPAETLGSPSPPPASPGWGRRGLADPSSFSYSFNFCLLLKGAQSSGLGSLGSPLESAAGWSFSLPCPHPTPTSLGADQDTTEGRSPQLALKCSPRMELGTLYHSLTL